MAKAPQKSDATRTLPSRRHRAPPAQVLRVEVCAGPDAGLVADVPQRAVVIGRSPRADVKVTDPTVSSFHCELRVVDRGIAVADLNSHNGTVHAGVWLEKAIVPSGTELTLGHDVVRVHAGASFDPPAEDTSSFGDLRGRSRVIRELFYALRKLAATDLSVLIQGPTGTGKELIARAIHDTSARAKERFIVVDCTAIPHALAEGLLFGYERGAYTGAETSRAGPFEEARGGTVFLDEVGELPLDLQPKLLRLLEQRSVTRVGSHRPIPVDVRIVTATWRDLRAMLNRGEFREDLYYRIAQTRVEVPSLEERPDDIPVLVNHFLQALPAGVPGARTLSAEALETLQRRSYPGNVRELRNLVERAAVLAAGTVITPDDLQIERLLTGESSRGMARRQILAAFDEATESDALQPFKNAKRNVVDEFEKAYLDRLLQRVGRNLSRASLVAGVERHHLRDLLRKHGLQGND